MELNGKVYLGVVEDNLDPDKENKCRIRVINIFDGIPVESIPWATPWKDTNGIMSNLPNIGKVVSVEFENGDLYSPVYRYSEHYNVNLQDKLKDLNDDDYKSMSALLFDHKTQIYRNESEGLKLDHKFNMMNITESNINLNLKDNYGSVNLGTSDANQQAILGNNFLDWFDKFVDQLLGSSGGPYLGNLTAPVIPHPELITHLLQYKALKDPKFLSHNVNFNDNGYVEKLDRVNKSKIGDDWKSTTEDNTLSKEDTSEFQPQNGSKNQTPLGTLTSSEEDPNNEPLVNEPIELPDDKETHDDVLILIKCLNDKSYKIETEPYKMNIVGVRYQYPGNKYSNTFSDKLYVFYKDDKSEWNIKKYSISTMPGTQITISNPRYRKIKDFVTKDIIGTKLSLKKWAQYVGRSGLGILKPAQYVNGFKLGNFPRSGKYKAKALLSVNKQIALRDSNWDSNKITYSSEEIGNFGMHIHRGFPGGVNVNNWSEGCQVFSNQSSLDSFIELMEIHDRNHKNKFTYTLILSNDYDKCERELREGTN